MMISLDLDSVKTLPDIIQQITKEVLTEAFDRVPGLHNVEGGSDYLGYWMTGIEADKYETEEIPEPGFSVDCHFYYNSSGYVCKIEFTRYTSMGAPMAGEETKEITFDMDAGFDYMVGEIATEIKMLIGA